MPGSTSAGSGRADRVSPRRIATLAALAAAGVLLSGCSDRSYTWAWHILWPDDPRALSNLMFLVHGFWATVSISVAAVTISMTIGLLVALMGISKNRALFLLSRVYVEVFRSIPILVMILWVYYGLPILTGVQFTVFVTGLICLAISDSAFTSEIFRGGLQSVKKGQSEAALSLGLTKAQTMRLVILPQVIRAVLPALGNQFVYILKMSSLVSVIGYQELTRRANELTLAEQRPLEIYTFLVLEYLVLILLVSWGVRVMERRMGSGQHARD